MVEMSLETVGKEKKYPFAACPEWTPSTHALNAHHTPGGTSWSPKALHSSLFLIQAPPLVSLLWHGHLLFPHHQSQITHHLLCYQVLLSPSPYFSMTVFSEITMFAKVVINLCALYSYLCNAPQFSGKNVSTTAIFMLLDHHHLSFCIPILN